MTANERACGGWVGTVRAGMRAYFDAFSGISGDMTVGALLDLGVSFDALRDAIASLGLPDVVLAAAPREHDGIRATKFDVRIGEPPGERTFAVIRAIVDRGALARPVRER